MHFLKIRTRKKKRLNASASARKEPHRKLVFASRASWGAGHALAPPDRLLGSMVFRWCLGPCAVPPPPPASDRPSSSPAKAGVKVAFVRTGSEEQGSGARPTKASSLLQAEQVGYWCRFHNFQLQGYTAKRKWLKQGNVGGEGCTVHDGRGFTIPPSPVRWLWEERGEVRVGPKRWRQCGRCWAWNLLSFVGRGFFSWVSVFFSLDLSKLVTSETSGLSLIVADLQADEKEFWVCRVMQQCRTTM